MLEIPYNYNNDKNNETVAIVVIKSYTQLVGMLLVHSKSICKQDIICILLTYNCYYYH